MWSAYSNQIYWEITFKIISWLWPVASQPAETLIKYWCHEVVLENGISFFIFLSFFECYKQPRCPSAGEEPTNWLPIPSRGSGDTCSWLPIGGPADTSTWLQVSRQADISAAWGVLHSLLASTLNLHTQFCLHHWPPAHPPGGSLPLLKKNPTPMSKFIKVEFDAEDLATFTLPLPLCWVQLTPQCSHFNSALCEPLVLALVRCTL